MSATTTEYWAHQLADAQQYAAVPGHFRFWDPRTGKTRGTVLEIAIWIQQFGIKKILIVAPVDGCSVWLKEDELGRFDASKVCIVDLSTDDPIRERSLVLGSLKQVRPTIVVVNRDVIFRKRIVTKTKEVPDVFAGTTEISSTKHYAGLLDALLKWGPEAVVLDECVPAGTLVSTPYGDIPIEALTVGAVVWGFDEAAGTRIPAIVTQTFAQRSTAPLVKINDVTMTANHPVWIGTEYIAAGRLQDNALVYYTTTNDPSQKMRPVRASVRVHQDNPNTQVLLQSLQQCCNIRRQELSGLHHFETQPVSNPRSTDKGFSCEQSSRLRASNGGEWHGDNSPSSLAAGATDRLGSIVLDSFRRDTLRDRYSASSATDRNRGRWTESQRQNGSCSRRSQGQALTDGGMGGSPDLEQRDFAGPSQSSQAITVYNIETSTGNYFAGGLAVHNCHDYRRISSKRGQAAEALAKRARFRRGLSGTPDPRDYLDFYGQYKIVAPHVFGTRKSDFQDRYCKMSYHFPNKVDGYRNVEELRAKLFSVASRVRQEDCFDMPEILPDIFVDVPLSRLARELYSELTANYVAEFLGIELDATHQLSRLTILHQLAQGFVRDEQGNPEWVFDGKIKAAHDYIEEMLRADKRVVVYHHYTPEGERLFNECVKEYGAKRVGRLSGGVTRLDRSPHPFADRPQMRVFVAQESTAQLAISLREADHVLWYSWGPAADVNYQARQRIFDERSKKPHGLSYTFLRSVNTADAFMTNTIARKRTASQMLLDFGFAKAAKGEA